MPPNAAINRAARSMPIKLTMSLSNEPRPASNSSTTCGAARLIAAVPAAAGAGSAEATALPPWVKVVAAFEEKLCAGSDRSKLVRLSVGSEFPRRVSGPLPSDCLLCGRRGERVIAQIAGETVEQQREAEVVVQSPFHYRARMDHA
jgi:hypothetical protein